MSIPVIDRLQFAATLAKGKRVLDIGGQKMPNCGAESVFSRHYRRIGDAAREYKIADYQALPSVDFVLDLNHQEGVAQLDRAIESYRPELILCMETLEHLNCHYEVMNILAKAVQHHGALVFITLPNNGNWIFNALGWNVDHVVAFFRDVAQRFVSRSELGRHSVTRYACMQQYIWYWPIAYVLAGFQPLSWGFLIEPRDTKQEGA